MYVSRGGGGGGISKLFRFSRLYLIGERSEPLSTVFNDQPRDIYIFTRNVLLSAQMGERASVVLICIITSLYNEVK